MYLQNDKIKLVKFTRHSITPEYMSWLNDSDVNRYLDTGRIPIAFNDVFVPDGRDNMLFMIMTNVVINSESELVLTNAYSNYIGTASLHKIDWISRRGEVGYMLGDKRYWGAGLATGIVGLLTDYGFNRINLNKITAGVVDGNDGSKRVLERNGYKQYAIEPRDYYLEGKYLDTIKFYKMQEWH